MTFLINESFTQNKERLFEFYKLAIASKENYEERKSRLNSFFLTINSLLVTGYGLISSNFSGQKIFNLGTLAIVLVGLGSIIEWKKLLVHTNHHLQLKNQQIMELEKFLELRLFTYEKDLIYKNERWWLGRFFVENQIPVTFLFLYLFFLYSIFAL